MAGTGTRGAAAHESLADTVYQRVKHDIAEFRLVPGDRFTETEVAQRLGVSRTPVRQALFRLQREGFVQVQFRAGWMVQPFDFEAHGAGDHRRARRPDQPPGLPDPPDAGAAGPGGAPARTPGVRTPGVRRPRRQSHP